MSKTFENKPQLGAGVYTTKEIAQILQIPYNMVHTWINKYWDGELGKLYEQQYSWSVNDSRAVSFHSLVEFYVMVQFSLAGVPTRQVLNAHKELSRQFRTKFPFAQKNVLDSIQTDGKRVFLSQDGNIITLDGSKQLNLDFLKGFFKKLDFDDDLIASRLWPLGKSHRVVCDPHHKFGLPVIAETNIQAEAIYKMYQAKEPIDFIAELYEIPVSHVQDAIALFKQTA